ncbi:MAG: Flp pilus assembly pilin Flp [Planctomycetaceae bacterium]
MNEFGGIPEMQDGSVSSDSHNWLRCLIKCFERLGVFPMRQQKVTTLVSSADQGVKKSNQRRTGAVTVEYILLITLVGLGSLVGLAAVRNSLINELTDLAAAIAAITP